MREVYEKPQMKFVSLRNSENVAATCWGNHTSKVYYDVNLKDYPGYLEFVIGGGNCSLGGLTAKYYEKGKDPVDVVSGNPAYDELYKKLQTSGGSDGNPFDKTAVPGVSDEPQPGWSF